MVKLLGQFGAAKALYYLAVAGREGRLHNGAFLPVQEFGLRVSVYTTGDVSLVFCVMRSR